MIKPLQWAYKYA